MKRFFPYILILIILVGFFSPFVNLHAQGTNPIQAAGDTWDMIKCFAAPGQCFMDVTTDVITGLLYLLLTLISFLLYIAGTLLDFVLQFTIVDMKANLDKLIGINIAWKTIKDLMNIAFIFILVYEGIKMIIGQGSRENVRNFIAMVILASLLINFSLFFTKVLIDASNIVTVGFYNSITGGQSVELIGLGNPNGTPEAPGRIGSWRINGISVPFMNSLGVAKFWENRNFENLRTISGGNTNMILIPLMGIILFLVVSFVFFAVAIIFIIRYLTLVILLILSPVAYMGMALPAIKPYASDWWKALNSQLLFAPLYMVMTWVILNLMNAQGFIVNGEWGNLINNTGATPASYTQNSISLIFNFVMIIGLIIASLILAKRTSDRGSNYIKDATGRLTTFAGGAVMGGAGRFGRGTLGRYGNNLANNEDLKDRAAKGSFSARMQLAAGSKMASSSFDTRATKSFGSLAKTAGMDFGKVDTKKQNFRAIQDQKAKDQEETLKRYKVSDLEVQRIKNKLKSDEFKAEEELAKAKHLDSIEFKESTMYKNSQKAEEENKKLKELTEKQKKDAEKLKKLEDTKVVLVGEELMNRNAEIENLKNEISNDKKSVEALSESTKEREKVIEARANYEKMWMSEAKQDLISRSGGQEEKKDKGGNVTQVAVDSQYQIRANQIADRYESRGSRISDYTKKISAIAGGGALGFAVAGIPGSLIGGSLAKDRTEESVATKSERAEIARRIRKAAGGKKSVDDRLKEILKDEGELKDKEEEKEEKKEEEKPKEGETSK